MGKYIRHKWVKEKTALKRNNDSPLTSRILGWPVNLNYDISLTHLSHDMNFLEHVYWFPGNGGKIIHSFMVATHPPPPPPHTHTRRTTHDVVEQ